jgi:hypothetical protein
VFEQTREIESLEQSTAASRDSDERFFSRLHQLQGDVKSSAKILQSTTTAEVTRAGISCLDQAGRMVVEHQECLPFAEDLL